MLHPGPHPSQKGLVAPLAQAPKRAAAMPPKHRATIAVRDRIRVGVIVPASAPAYCDRFALRFCKERKMGFGLVTYLVLGIITFVIPALVLIGDDAAWHTPRT
jgi:hypothetical protein